MGWMTCGIGAFWPISAACGVTSGSAAFSWRRRLFFLSCPQRRRVKNLGAPPKLLLLGCVSASHFSLQRSCLSYSLPIASLGSLVLHRAWQSTQPASRSCSTCQPPKPDGSSTLPSRHRRRFRPSSAWSAPSNRIGRCHTLADRRHRDV